MIRRDDVSLRRWLRAAVIACVVLGAGACISEAERSTGQPLCAPLEPIDDFRRVNNVLEKRCGTLDCHGDIARPFIVYGQSSFRRPGGETLPPPEGPMIADEYYPGGEATTEFELLGTYQSICGLEPEKMDQVVKNVAADDTLTLVRKPRLQEKHKGGQLWSIGSIDGDLCLLSWIHSSVGDPMAPDRETVDIEACRRELTHL
jgi:hypothetical protein